MHEKRTCGGNREHVLNKTNAITLMKCKRRICDTKSKCKDGQHGCCKF